MSSFPEELTMQCLCIAGFGDISLVSSVPAPYEDIQLSRTPANNSNTNFDLDVGDWDGK